MRRGCRRRCVAWRRRAGGAPWSTLRGHLHLLGKSPWAAVQYDPQLTYEDTAFRPNKQSRSPCSPKFRPMTPPCRGPGLCPSAFLLGRPPRKATASWAMDLRPLKKVSAGMGLGSGVQGEESSGVHILAQPHLATTRARPRIIICLHPSSIQ